LRWGSPSGFHQTLPIFSLVSSTDRGVKAGWSSGTGLFGYTTTPGAYPAINKPLSSGPNTYYFRTHFNWDHSTSNLAFVVTNYLSDGAVYYLNGGEVRRIRMPGGVVGYGTAATGVASPVGSVDIFGLDDGVLE